MSKSPKTSPFPIWETLVNSTNFILKNISWILPLGVIILLGQYASDLSKAVSESAAETDSQDYKFILQILSTFFLAPLFTGAIVAVRGEQLQGGLLAWYEGFQKSFKKLMPLVLLNLVILVAVLVGFILLFVPGIIVACASAFAFPAMMFEDLGPIKAFKRSWNLTKGYRFRIFLLFLVPALIFLSVTLSLFLISTALSVNIIYTLLVFAMLLALYQALGPVVNTLLFFELRRKNEALDSPQETADLSATKIEQL